MVCRVVAGMIWPLAIITLQVGGASCEADGCFGRADFFGVMTGDTAAITARRLSLWRRRRECLLGRGAVGLGDQAADFDVRFAGVDLKLGRRKCGVAAEEEVDGCSRGRDLITARAVFAVLDLAGLGRSGPTLRGVAHAATMRLVAGVF